MDLNVGCALGSRGEHFKNSDDQGEKGKGRGKNKKKILMPKPHPPKFWFNWSGFGLGIESVKVSPGGFSMHDGGYITASHREEVDFSAGNGGYIFLFGPELD